MITTVDSSQALASALKTTAAGDTILLAPGSYSMVLSKVDLGGVVIASANPSNQAVMTNIDVVKSSGVTFRDLELIPDEERAFKVQNSEDVHFEKLYVHGSLDGDPSNDVRAFSVHDSSNISFSGSEFEELHFAIGHLNVDHLTVTGNSFHDIRIDGVRGGGSSYVTITDNTFTDFYPVAGDHADAIQFWTTNVTTNTHDILVANNQITRGAGERIQGVFFGDETPGIYYERIRIEGNLVSGASYHAITLESGRDFNIENNVVQGYTDLKSWLRVDKSSDGVVANNKATLLTLTANNTNLVQSGNEVIAYATDAGAAALAQWKATVLSIGTGDTGGLRLIGGTGADTLTGGLLGDTLSDTAGSNLIRGGDGDDKLTGGVAFDDINGNIGNDTLDGGAGGDWVVGGKNEDMLAGGAGDDVVFGNLGADTADGGDGADIVRGGQGDDVVRGGAGADLLWGDRGNDTVTGGAGADVFNVFADASVEYVTDFKLAEGDRVHIEGGVTYSVTQVGADTVIDLAGGAHMVLAGVSLSSLTGDWIV